MPDLFLDELQEILAVNCGRNVSRVTVWRTLCRAGYTIKKVGTPLHCCTQCDDICRLHESLPNVQQRSGWTISLELVNIKHHNWSLWTKVLLIIVQRIEAMPSQYVEQKHSVKLFLSEADGLYSLFTFFFTVLIDGSFSVLPAISLNHGMLHCDIVEGSFMTMTFMEFIDGLLDLMHPFPAENSIIVMDNCKIHKDPRICQMIEDR
jgi:hypothetical protein